MITERQKKEFYRAFLEKNKAYEGIFFIGIKTTGIFCRPTCSARKAKMKNCDFFEIMEEALSASFKPCKRCKPLLHDVSEVVQKLMDAVEKDPEKQWKENDLKKFSVDASTVRRQFKKRFGMTFVAYARARRMGRALKQMKEGKAVIEAQLSSGYESGSGFREAFGKIIEAAPSDRKNHQVLTAAWIDTPLGSMLVIADEKALYLLEFIDRRGLSKEIERFKKKMNLPIIPGKTKPLQQIEAELKGYFSGKLREFKTPVAFLGTPFQKKVWEELRKIPFGETRFYAEIAVAIGKPSAFRAVASANGSNQLAIAIPCHRVINSSGALGGYAGGIKKKEWLLKHEK